MTNEFQNLDKHTPAFIKSIAATLRKEFANSITVYWNRASQIKVVLRRHSVMWDVCKNELVKGSCKPLETAVKNAVLDYEYKQPSAFPFYFHWEGSGFDPNEYEKFSYTLLVLNEAGEAVDLSNCGHNEQSSQIRALGIDLAKLQDNRFSDCLNANVAIAALVKAGVKTKEIVPAYGGVNVFHLEDQIKHFGVPRKAN
ncbi:MAG: hypothetical protein ACKO0Z_20945 [Betaproteobacteria bacterium]